MDIINKINEVVGIETIFFILILIFSIIVHEVAHGLMALYLGDKTAENAGRLTLNPIPHIDPIGSILIPAMLIIAHSPFYFGYAKPVPYNPSNLKNQKWGNAMVAAAGPISNFILAFIFTVVYIIFAKAGFDKEVIYSILGGAIFMNIFLAILNLLPIPPLDGSKVFLDVVKAYSHKTYMKIYNIFNQYSLFLMIGLLVILVNTSFLGKIAFGVMKVYQAFMSLFL